LESGPFLAALIIGLILGAVGASVYWQGQVEALQARVQELEQEKASLEDKVAADKSRIVTLEGMVNRLEEENSLLREELARANETIQELLEERQALLEQLAQANATIQSLEDENLLLQWKVDDLTYQVEELQAEVERLQAELRSLEARLNATKAAYESLMDMVRRVAYWYDYYPVTYEEQYFQHMDQVLQASIETSPTPPQAGVLEMVEWVFNYTMENLQYYWDPYARVYIPGASSPVPWPQVTMLPNETMEIGGGDCEDLALLAYGSLAQFLGPENVYLIYIIVPDGYGHAATLARTPDGYIIVDPAGNYLNGGQAILRIGSYGYNPLALDPELRKLLVANGDAELTGPGLPQPSQDLQGLLQDWLEDYWGFTGYTLTIHALGLHETGLTLQEAVETIQSHQP